MVIRQSTNVDQRMITKVETSDVAAENAIFHTLLFTLTLRPSMKDKLLKGQTHHNSRLVEEEVVLAKSIL